MSQRLVPGGLPRQKIPEQLGILQFEQARERRTLLACSHREPVLEVADQQFIEFPHAAPAPPAQPPEVEGRRVVVAARAQCCRSAIIFLISAMALAGLRSFGQASAQFMIVWQR
jgi:hypothetical protein